jgi:hypothetical protein
VGPIAVENFHHQAVDHARHTEKAPPKRGQLSRDACSTPVTVNQDRPPVAAPRGRGADRAVREAAWWQEHVLCVSSLPQPALQAAGFEARPGTISNLIRARAHSFHGLTAVSVTVGGPEISKPTLRIRFEWAAIRGRFFPNIQAA